jgi:uncharacterized protein YrrD
MRKAMAQRVSEMLGKVVVSADNGEKLGTVSDVLIDETDHHLVGLVVRRGLMKSEHVLPSAAVQTFGRDTVVSRTGRDLVSAKEWNTRPSLTPGDAAIVDERTDELIDPGLR